MLDQADARGGPAAWARSFGPADARRLAPLRYRWIGGGELALLARALGDVLDQHCSLQAAFLHHDRPAQPTVAPGLEGLVGALRTAASRAARLSTWTAAPRGLRYLLPAPSSGSACKRWCMFLRWMVRRPGPGAAGVDFGLWRAVSPARLVMPVDTHVHRITRLMGLTARASPSWRMACELTEALRQLSPDDPLRHDFALAHLGISGHCRARWSVEACPACSLRPVCSAARAGGPEAQRT